VALGDLTADGRLELVTANDATGNGQLDTAGVVLSAPN
jgi:hypothetical protein